MRAVLFVSVLRFVQVISLLVRLHQRARLSVLQKRDFFLQSSVRRLEKLEILHFVYHTEHTVSLLMQRYSHVRMAMSFLQVLTNQYVSTSLRREKSV